MEQNLLPLHLRESPFEATGRRRSTIDAGRLSRREGADGLAFALGVLDAHRIKISHLYDKLSSLSNSRTRLLPHQIEATYRVANALRPRYILADEVGLGKTIEAGLIMKELVFRKGYNRILICVPAPLCIQWQQELKNKFNEEFTLLNRKNYYACASNWAAHPKILTSIDFIKNPKYAEDILKSRWDIVVFDEAHRLRRDYNKVTHAYAFAEKIARKAEGFFLLTATPFRGKLEELYYLVSLVDPHLLGPHNSFVQEYVLPNREAAEGGEYKKLDDLRDKISRVMLRRRKVDVGGFTKRHARTVRLELSPEERAFYDETTDYVRREYNLAMREKNRAVSFIMIVFQKLLDSSTRALLRALEKRKAHLEQKMFGLRGAGRSGFPAANGAASSVQAPSLHGHHPNYPGDPAGQGGSTGAFEGEVLGDWIDRIEDSDDPESELEELDSDAGVDDRGKTLKDLRKEVLTLQYLIQLGRKVKHDRKLTKLVEVMERLKKEGHHKFVLFTQFRTTQDYIGDQLTNFGFRISIFHGGLSLQAKEDAIQAFKEDLDVLICTEAGGEGRNLQFANILINYDLPWSPLKIEQRIGRVHRFGQTKDVFIVNFSTRDTVAERVLEVLEHKVRLFEEAIGPPDILLGAIEDEMDFESSLMSFVAGGKTQAELEAEVEARIKMSEAGYSRLNDLVTPRCLDFNLTDYYAYTNEERSIDNCELENICRKYLHLNPESRWGLAANAEWSGEPAFSTPRIADFLLTDRENGQTRPATFRSDLALESDRIEFLAVGHPLVDAALQYFLEHPERRSLQLLYNAGRGPGFYFVFLCQFQNGMSRAELLSCVVSGENQDEVEVLEDLLLPPGAATEDFCRPAPDDVGRAQGLASDRVDSIPVRELERAGRAAIEVLQAEAERRAEELKESLHTVFKKEEYKLEISYGKKIRQLEEKLDRARLKHRMEPTAANRSQLTRLENELVRARQEREQRVYRIRRESRVDARLELLQAYALR